MDPKTASMAIQFLQRAQLSGAEVPAFLAVIQALDVFARNPVGMALVDDGAPKNAVAEAAVAVKPLKAARS